MKKHTLGVSLISSLALGTLLIGTAAFAQTTPVNHAWGPRMSNRAPDVFGTVTAISGTTITIDSKGFGKDAAETTYTIDAKNATVMKNGKSSSLSGIASGDTIMVGGTVSGTNVTATTIHDGTLKGIGPRGQRMKNDEAQDMSALPRGNGQPVVGGTITAISGNMVTITNKSNVIYTIDATSAAVTKGKDASSVANLAVGDEIVAQGTVNGTSVTASSIIDQGTVRKTIGSDDGQQSAGPMGGFFGGLFGRIGGIFHRAFGFF